MRVLAIANLKGGCGKTTTSINFAACLALLHKKVLIVDMDPQGHSTCGLGVREREAPQGTYDLLTPYSAVLSASPLIHRIDENLSLIPAYTRLAEIESEMAGVPGIEKKLRQQLRWIDSQMPGFDYVILDCPPNLGSLTFNALEASDEIIIPIEPSFFSLHGLAKMTETLAGLNLKRTHPVEINALLTIFDSRTCFGKEVYEEVRGFFKEKLFKSIIHESVLLKEAAGAGKSIVQYDRGSGAFRDYFNLAVEYLERQLDRALPAKKLGWDNAVQSHFGPRKVHGGILFQTVSKNARTVELAGDFNNWIPEPMISREEGLWQKIIPITAGTYRYKYIIDGEWQVDPGQPFHQLNAFGTFDSFLDLNLGANYG